MRPLQFAAYLGRSEGKRLYSLATADSSTRFGAEADRGCGGDLTMLLGADPKSVLGMPPETGNE